MFMICSFSGMPDIEFLRSEIERMRYQVHRQRGEILQLRRAGIPTTSAEALLDRMLTKIDGLCAERDRLKKERPGHNRGKVLGGRQWCDISTTNLTPRHFSRH